MAENKGTTKNKITVQNASMADVFDFFNGLQQRDAFNYGQYYFAVRRTWVTLRLTNKTSPESFEVYQVSKNARDEITGTLELGNVTFTQITAVQIELTFDGLLEVVSQPNFDNVFKAFWDGLEQDLNQKGLLHDEYSNVTKLRFNPELSKQLNPKFVQAWPKMRPWKKARFDLIIYGAIKDWPMWQIAKKIAELEKRDFFSESAVNKMFTRKDGVSLGIPASDIRKELSDPS